MIGKPYDEVSDKIKELDCSDGVSKSTIEKLLSGVDSDDESDIEPGEKSESSGGYQSVYQ